MGESVIIGLDDSVEVDVVGDVDMMEDEDVESLI